MAVWRVEIDGPLRVRRGDESFHPRTRHQRLLLLRLAAGGAMGIDREATATMLWPDAERPYQSAYLRRAIMELRRAGLPIESDGARLAVASGALALGNAGNPEAILSDVEHPIADEIRRTYPAKPPVEIVRSDSERLMLWIGETLVREHPEIAVEMLARHGQALIATLPPEPLLSLFLRALEASVVAGASRADVIRLAAQEAMYLTRYGQAERLARWAVEECRALDSEALLAVALASLAFLQMERRRWPEALENGRLAAELARRTGHGDALAVALNGYAGIQWHTLRFEEALADYAVAYEATGDPGIRLRIAANVALVVGVYGKTALFSLDPPDGPCEGIGAVLLAECNLRIGYGLAHDRPDLVVRGCARLLRIASASGMDRLFCLALDYAAYAFARFGRRAEAVACVRIGSAQRLAVGHHRSPAESLAIRLHVRPPYFGPEIETLCGGFAPGDPALCAERVAARLERALVLRKDTVGIRPPV